jgi:hypothetical protein
VLDIETPIKLFQKIEKNLQARELSQAGPSQIEAQCQKLLDVVQSAIETSIPWAKPSVCSIPDFDDEYKAAVKEVRRLRRRRTVTRDPYDWMRYSESHNMKNLLVKKALFRAHRRRVQQVIEDCLFPCYAWA